MPNHNHLVVDQFTRQAEAFAVAPQIRSEDALNLLISGCKAFSTDLSLDVACGPGIVTCAFAKVVQHATGIDLTPAMIAQGQKLAAEKGIQNLTLCVGDVYVLPFEAEAFSIVTSRYAFHHLEEPQRVLEQMVRVCKPNGRVAIMDLVASDSPDKAAAFNRMERLRDPSHVRALTLAEWLKLFENAGLKGPRVQPYKMHVEVEGLLKASFPNAGDADMVREMIADSVVGDLMGIDARTKDGALFFSYPIALMVAERE